MASATRTIRTIFTGDASALGAAALVARRNIDGYDRVLKKIEATQAAVRRAVVLTGAAMTAAGAAAPVLLAGASVLFIGLAAAGLAASDKVRKSFTDTGKGIRDAFVADTSVLEGTALQVADKVGRAYTRIRPLLQQTFAGLAPQVLMLTDGVLSLATNALPGLSRAALAATPAMRGLRDFLATTGTAVSQFFDNISRAGPQAGQVFDQLAALIAQVLPVLGQLLALATNFASGVLPNLVGALGLLLSPLSAILSFLTPIAPALGDVAGTVLIASAALRVMSGAMIALLAAGAGLALMSGNLAAFGARAIAAVAAFTPFGPMVARALGPVDRFTGVVGRVGGLLLGATVAITASAIAWDALTVSSSEAKDALKQGGDAAAEAARGLETQTQAVQALSETTNEEAKGAAVALDLFTTSTDELRASLDAVGNAQLDAAFAQKAYNDAVRLFGPDSQQAITAGQALGDATDRVKQAQDDAARATKGHTASLIELAETMLAQGNAALQYEQAQLRIKTAEEDLVKTLKEHKAGSDEVTQANLTLKQAYLASAEAAGKKAEADNASLGPQEAAKAGARAQAEELGRLASTANGPARAALISLINTFDSAGVRAAAAELKARGFNVEIQRTPTGREVIVSVETGKAESDLKTLARDRTSTIHVYIKQHGSYQPQASAHGLAAGGPVHGPGTGTSDTAGLFALSNGEHVWTAAEVRAAGGHRMVELMRAAALRGTRGMADGGPVGLGSAVAVGPTNVRVFLGTREITDVIRTEIDRNDREVARRVGAGGGTSF